MYKHWSVCLDVQKRKVNRASVDNQERASDASDRDGSPDDFEEIRPKTKRSRVSEGTPASVPKIELSLIGKWTKTVLSIIIWHMYV